MEQGWEIRDDPDFECGWNHKRGNPAIVPIAMSPSWNRVNKSRLLSSFGKPRSPRNLLCDYKKLLHTAGLPPNRFYDLRHTAASILLNQGVPGFRVSRRLGHAKASITLDIYGHLIPSMQTEVAEMIDDLVMPVTIQLGKKVVPES